MPTMHPATHGRAPSDPTTHVAHASPAGAARPLDADSSYTIQVWDAECYAVFGEGRDPVPCPACGRTGFYGPRIAEPAERYRACRFCGFTQHVGGRPERYQPTVHGCDGWPECARAPYIWWVPPNRTAYTCSHCAKRVAVADHVVAAPAADSRHPWWKVPQHRTRAYYRRFWENWPVSKGRIYL